MNIHALIYWWRRLGPALAKWPLLRDPRVRKVLLWVAGIIGVVLLIWLVAIAWAAMGPRIKQLLLLLVVVVAVLIWFVKGLPWLGRRQMLRRAKGDLAPGNLQDEEEPRRNMLQALLQTKQVLARSPEVARKRDPLYAIPWFLFIGDSRSSAKELLRAAAASSPFGVPQRADSATQYWHWWLFKGMIAIEADPRFVCDDSDRVTRGIWYHALQQLNAERKNLPLNGVAVLVSAEALIGDQEDLRRYALNLRRLVDECLEHLQIVAPIYVIVTGCEKLPGYESFVSQLPLDALRQAVGHRLEGIRHIDASTWQSFNGIFSGLCDRLHAIRMSAIRREADPGKRKAIWDFGQTFAYLGTGLSVVVKTLLEDNPFMRTPQWRGIYFTAAAGKGAFVEDLFTRFLPTDQPLARATRHPGFRRWMGTAVSIALVAMLTGVVVYQASRAVSDNRRIAEAVAHACGELTPGTSSAALSECTEQLTTVEDLEQQAGLTWGISQYKQDLAQKKALLLPEIRRILDSYDARIEYDISSRSLAVDHVLSSAQRLTLIDRCASGASQCRREPDEPNLVFDPTSQLYTVVEPFTSKKKDTRQAEANGLLDLYVAYLRWAGAGDDQVLSDESRKVQDYLRESIALRPLSVDDILAWSKPRYEPITAESLWEVPEAASRPGRKAPLPTVDAAFTQRVWHSVLQPFLAQMASVAGDPGVVSALKEAYFERYFAAWRDFLAGFAQGIRGFTKASAPELLARAAQGDSPYVKLWRAVRENLLALPLEIGVGARWAITWQQIKQDWTGTLGHVWRFLGESAGEKKNSIAPPTWVSALKYSLDGGWKAVEEELVRYCSTLQADPSGAKALALAREIFTSNADKPAQFAALKTAAETPPARFEKMKGDELPAWQSLAGELQMLLTLITYQAAVRVDDEWKTRAYPEIKRDSEVNPGRALQLGIQRFSQGTLAGFVNEADGKLKQVLGVSMPLSRRFQALLSEQGKGLTPSADGKPIRIGTIEVIQPSTYGMVREGPEGTTVEITCGTNKFSVSSKGQSRVDRQLQIVSAPELCLTAVINVALPDYDASAAAPGNRGPVPRILTKSYTEDVFGKLAEDFKSGAKTFTLADFKPSYLPQEWDVLSQHLKMLAINQVRVYAAVTLSPEMEQHVGPAPSSDSLPITIIE